jgi:hypothetical protein
MHATATDGVTCSIGSAKPSVLVTRAPAAMQPMS